MSHFQSISASSLQWLPPAQKDDLPVHLNFPSLSELMRIHAQYNRTIGASDNGNEWKKFRAVSRSSLAFPCFVLCLVGVEAEGLLDYQGRAEIISIVRWNLRLVIFGVDRTSIEPELQMDYIPVSTDSELPQEGGNIDEN